MPVVAGHVYIAPGGHQFSIERIAEGYVCRVTREPRVNLHRPSVQVLFQSVARQAGARAIGVMLTGMGADGAQGLLEMRRAGAYQDEQSSVVGGRPGAAAKMGAANEVLPLDEIPRAIAELIGAERGSLKRRLARRRSTRGHKPLE
jgi:two-component system chemotaxis response regulator CheB